MDTPNSNGGLRDGRVITVGVIACALLLSAACVSPVITAFEMDESNWRRIATTRFLFVWGTVSFGFATLAVCIVTSFRQILTLTAVSLLLGVLAAIYPSGIQLLASPLEANGQIVAIDLESSGKRIRMLPTSRTVSIDRRVRLASVTIVDPTGNEQILQVLPQDLTDEMLGATSESQWQFQFLPYLNRFIFAQRSK